MGDLQVELWGKQAPKAVRNFLQLALEGFYDDTSFTHIVPKCLIQGGHGSRLPPPSEFPREHTPRLKLGRRGLLAMTNISPDNGIRHCTQFFLTLGPVPDLERQATIFGKITGDTIYNLVRMEEVDDARTIVIRRIKVVINPFDDIIPRSFSKDDALVGKKSAAAGGRLSFMPDTLESKPTMRSTDTKIPKQANLDEAKQKELQQLQAQIAQMKRQILNPTTSTTKEHPEPEKEEGLSLVEQQRRKYQQKRKRPLDEMDTLLELNRFREKIASSTTTSEHHVKDENEQDVVVRLCKLHGLVECQSCHTLQPPINNEDGEVGWMTHRLHFADSEYSRSIREHQRQDLQDLVVIDPRKKN